MPYVRVVGSINVEARSTKFSDQVGKEYPEAGHMLHMDGASPAQVYQVYYSADRGLHVDVVSADQVELHVYMADFEGWELYDCVAH